MRLAKYRDESTLSELAERLFRIRAGSARAKEAEAALLKANPQLRDLKKLPKGSMLLVPEVAEVKDVEDEDLVVDAADEILDSARRTLEAVQPALTASVRRQQQAAEKSLEVLKSKEIRRSVEADEGLAAQISQAEELNRARLKELKDLQDFYAQGLLDLEQGFGELLTKLPVPHLEAQPVRKRRAERLVYHVVYQSEQAIWRVLEEGKERPESLHETKSEAVDHAREMAKARQPSQIIVHKQDGKIQYEHTYGDDPRRSPG